MEDHWDALALVIPEGTEIIPGFIITNPGLSGPLLDSNNLNIHTDFTYGFPKLNETLIGGIPYDPRNIFVFRVFKTIRVKQEQADWDSNLNIHLRRV